MSASSRSRTCAEIARAARASGRIALDTEFMGEGRYRTLLCLIQLAVPDGADADERIELVDPLAEDLDGAPLADVLADPAIQVVVHAGRQDIALIRRRFCSTEVQERVRHAGRGRLRRDGGAGLIRLAAGASCSACGSPRARASRAGTPARSRAEQLRLRARGRRAPARAGGASWSAA